MLNKPVRVRFAPSPTGELHVGNARTAVFNWIFARQRGGRLVLRIEDTDQRRAAKVFERKLLDDLQWLGIDWDEGPGKGGPFGPYHQSERLDIYADNLEKLVSAGSAYPCYCLEEELKAERESLAARRMMPRYMGTCRNLDLRERQRFERLGRRPAYRFKVEEGPVEFEDMVRGAMKFDGTAIGDFIILRSNGLPAYNFAAVVDDHLMEISHVIRGEDHLSNTASQILLYRALGFPTPVFAHHSLILGRDRTKLSKRHGATSVREFRNRGILPEVLFNYLSLVGNSFGKGKEVCSVPEIVELFSLENTGRGGAVFDEDKLKWLNGVFIKKYPPEKLMELIMPFVAEAGYVGDHAIDPDVLMSIVGAVQGNLGALAEIKNYLQIFHDGKCELSEEARAFLQTGEAYSTLKTFHDFFSSEEYAEENAYEGAIKKVQVLTGLKGRSLFLPLRCAITGSMQGPELDKVVAVLGRRAVIKRLERALEMMTP